MDHLLNLGLADTAISDAGVARLIRLPRLGTLGFGGPNIRSVRLVELKVLDESGLPAVRSVPGLGVEGRVEIAPHLGIPSYVRVTVCPPGGLHARVMSHYLWDDRFDRHITGLVEETPGTWTFRGVLPHIPPGRSTVEVWVVFARAVLPSSIQYRMEPRPIDLTQPGTVSAIHEESVR